VQLSLRDKNGSLLPGGFRMHYTDMDLAAPSKRERVVVLAGREKGKLGTVNVSLVSFHLFCQRLTALVVMTLWTAVSVQLSISLATVLTFLSSHADYRCRCRPCNVMTR
jgi:hypothetical protein